MSTRGWEWFAGLFEGEGCISIGPWRGNYRQVSLRIDSTDKDIIDELSRITEVGKTRGPFMSNKSIKPVYGWYATEQVDVHKILAMLYPYLGSRRKEKADEAFDYLNNHSKKIAALCD